MDGYCVLLFWWICFVGVILFWFGWVFLSLEVGAGGVVLVISGVFEFLVVVGAMVSVSLLGVLVLGFS